MVSADIKFIYIFADDELRRLGENYLLKHYFMTYQSRIILVKGYSVKGDNIMIECEQTMTFDKEKENLSLIEYFQSFLA